MADLYPIISVQGHVAKHAIFIHGLGGDPFKTWQSSLEPSEVWLKWLAEIEGLAVWTVGYNAAVSRWLGSAMHLTDRATDVLETLLLEPKLKTGEIIIIGHSFGGLVIKQLLRKADVASHQRDDVAEFLRRMHRVGFLATPHLGSGLSILMNRLRVILLPSAATDSMVRNDPNLRDLNQWYRDWSKKHGIEHLILTETQLHKAILVVKPDSSDPGLPEQPIPIDADHITICKPKDRSSVIYKHICGFIQRELKTVRREPEIEIILRTQGEEISSLKQTVIEQGEKTVESIAERIHAMEPISNATFNKKYPKDLIDGVIKERLYTIRRARFIQEYSAPEKILRLADQIQNGEFESGSDAVKCTTLAWCARFLAFSENIVKAEALLASAKLLGDIEEITLAEAFIIGAKGNLSGALNKLANLSSAVAKSASLFIVAKHEKNPSSTLAWLLTAGVTFADLDADGKFKYLTELIELDRWDSVIECVTDLQNKDYEDAPIIYHTAALAYLLKAIPNEIKHIVLQQVPFNSKTFFLASTEEALTMRRKAQNLFQEFAIAAQEFYCIETAKISSDYALWLELRDPEYVKSGLQKLESSMHDPAYSLRRLPLALNFGLKLDLDAVENEINRQTALSGDASPVAAMARFALVFMQKSPKESVDYIDRHREQLQKYLTKQSLDALEIEKLVESGLPRRAEERVSALITAGLSDAEHSSLLRIIATATAVDPIETRRAIFESSGIS